MVLHHCTNILFACVSNAVAVIEASPVVCDPIALIPIGHIAESAVYEVWPFFSHPKTKSPTLSWQKRKVGVKKEAVKLHSKKKKKAYHGGFIAIHCLGFWPTFLCFALDPSLRFPPCAHAIEIQSAASARRAEMKDVGMRSEVAAKNESGRVCIGGRLSAGWPVGLIAMCDISFPVFRAVGRYCAGKPPKKAGPKEN